MLIKELVIIIKDLLAKIQLEKEMARLDENGHISQESQYTISELSEFLKNHADSALDANAENLKPFVDLLAARYFNRIKSSDEMYYANMGTHANKIYIAIAQELEKLIGVSVHHLLLPELNKNIKFAKPLHHYIVSDDGQMLIDVLQCFEDSTSRVDGKFIHTHSFDGQSKELTEAEKDRLKGFSDKAVEPYKSIMQSKKATNTIKPLRVLLKDPKPFAIVKAYEFTYANKKEINDATSLEQLLIALEKHSSNKWHVILNAMPKDKLEVCIFPNKKIDYKAFVDSIPVRVKNDTECKIAQMCATVFYARDRDEGLDFVARKPSSTLFGWMGDTVVNNIAYLKGADSKQIKERVINILISYWSQERPGNVDDFFVAEFMKLHGDEFKENYQVQFLIHNRAFKNGDVGSMRQAAIDRLTPPEELSNAKVAGR